MPTNATRLNSGEFSYERARTVTDPATIAALTARFPEAKTSEFRDNDARDRSAERALRGA